MANFKFVTDWRFNAPISDIWDEIYHSERWPQWWKGVTSVIEIQPGDESGVGAVRQYTWRGTLPYRLTFEMRTTQVQECSRLEGEATGELNGRGGWLFSREASASLVRYEWEVAATKWWMRLAIPIARPVFEWNHDCVMRWGFEGLTRRLNQGITKRDSA